MKLKLAAAVLALAANTAFAGVITNGNFDSGLNGWTSNGNVTLVNNGGAAARLTAGLGAETYTTLLQSISLNAGDTLTGQAQFFGADYLPYNDNAYVKLSGNDLFYSSIANVGAYGTSALTSFSFTALVSGTYFLSAGVANSIDNVGSSTLEVRNFAVTNAVPEPASLALFGLALAGFVAARRRKLGK